MYSVTVRDHMMIAHSLRGEVFGPAQRLHGATYLVDATFSRAELGPELAGRNTTTEVLARLIADRLAGRIEAGALGESARGVARIGVTLRESHIAWASYERAL
jgi:6-pyruvoyl-tetrahydropterin synthase